MTQAEWLAEFARVHAPTPQGCACGEEVDGLDEWSEHFGEELDERLYHAGVDGAARVGVRG